LLDFAGYLFGSLDGIPPSYQLPLPQSQTII
jgi:hypothetical protein